MPSNFQKIANFQKKIDQVSKIGRSDKFLRQIGRKLDADIYFRVRSGLGNDSCGSEPKPFKALRPITIELRRKKKLHPMTSPEKSNLTESGLMMDSLQYQVSNGKLELSFKDIQRPVKPKKKGSKRKRKKPISNGALALLHEKGIGKLPPRPFINPTKKEWQNIIGQFITEIAKVFK